MRRRAPAPIAVTLLLAPWVAGLLAFAFAPWARAQELRPPEARQGYYIGGGLRTGVSGADADDLGGLGTLTHFGGLLRVGQMAFPWLGFGIALGGGTDTNETWSIGLGALLLEAQVEPFDFDLAFRVSAGVAGGTASRVNEVELEDDPDFLFGSLYSVGVSYDWFPFYDRKSYSSGGPAFTFFLEGRYFPGGDVTTAGGFFGVEFTWWTGLDKRKLELPVEKAFE